MPGPADRRRVADLATWRRRACETLDGESFEDALVTRLAGGLDVEPLYSADSLPADFDPRAVPGRPPYTRGGRAAGAGWRIAQEIAHPWSVEAAEAMGAEQRRGVRLLWLRLGGIVEPGAWDLEAATTYDGIRVVDVDDFEKLLAAVEAPAEVMLESGEEGLVTAAMWIAAARRLELEPRELRGSFGCDPLAVLATGGLRSSPRLVLRQLAELVSWSRERAPAMRGALVSTSLYHDAGATAVQQLAFALATGVCYLRQMTGVGLDASAAAAQLDFSFSVGRDVFLEIAKLRAARLLWSKVVGACGGGDEARRMRIHARTSWLEASRLGPWMNLVRGGAQSFAAATGGADSIRTAPWDEVLGWPEDRARRLAANVQHVLREEAHLDRVADAAGGSWYLESLTDRLARGAWDLFRELESHGGMDRCLAGGRVARLVAGAAGELRRSVADRTVPAVGASAFADLTEASAADKEPVRESIPRLPSRVIAEDSESISIQELLDSVDKRIGRGFGAMRQIDAALAVIGLSVEAPGEPGELMEVAVEAAVSGARGEQILGALREGAEPASCVAIERSRLTVPFEELRAASDRWSAEHGRRPRIFLLAQQATAGAVSPDRAFFRRLFAAGGLEAVEGGVFADSAGAADAFAEAEAEAAAILTGAAVEVERIGELAAALKRRGACAVYLAGVPEERRETLADAGVDGFADAGCDLVALARSCHDLLRRGEGKATPRRQRGEA